MLHPKIPTANTSKVTEATGKERKARRSVFLIPGTISLSRVVRKGKEIADGEGPVTQTVEDSFFYVNVLVLVNVHLPEISVLSGTFTFTRTCTCTTNTHFLLQSQDMRQKIPAVA